MRQFAFLNTIFKNVPGIGQVYEIVFSSKDFQHISTYKTDAEGLAEIICNDELVKDFFIEDGYLRCSAVPIIEGSIDVAEINKEIVSVKGCDNTLFSLLRLGIENNFCFIDEELVGHDVWSGNGISKFGNVRFSTTSMSIYLKMIKDDTIRNMYIASAEGSYVKIHDFYFIVPKSFTGVVPGSQYVKDIQVNYKEFRLYRTNDLMFDFERMISKPLINRAANYRNISDGLLKVFKSLVMQRDALHSVSEGSLRWVGEDVKDHHSTGICFEASKELLTKSEADAIAKQMLLMLQKPKEYVLDYLDKLDYLTTKNAALKLILPKLVELNTADEIDQFLLNAVYTQSVDLFNVDSFLYKVRILITVSGNSLLKPGDILIGSDISKEYTTVKGIGGMSNGNQ